MTSDSRSLFIRILAKILPGWLKQFLLDVYISLYHWRRRRKYKQLFRRYHDFTVVACDLYCASLGIADKVRQVPGAVVECGVWRGGMIAGMAELLGADRPYYLFDNFEGMPAPQAIDGLKSQMWWMAQEIPASPYYNNKYIADETEAEQAMKLTGAANYHIVKGWFEQTLAEFKPEAPIALLRIDVGWYEATMTCLQKLYPFVRAGGIIIIDDYYDWDGSARALHDFLSQEKLTDRVSQFDQAVCFVIKQT